MRRGASALAATAASTRFSTSILQAATPLLLAWAGVRLYGIALLTIALWVGSGVGSLLAAALGDPRRVSVTGLLTMAAGTLTLFLEPRLAVVCVPLAGLGSGLAASILPPILHMMSSSDRPFEGVARYSLSLSVGLVLAMAFTSLASMSSIRLAFIASALVSLSIALVLAVSRIEVPMVKVEVPSPADALALLASRPFGLPFTSNLAYSLVLPMIISYWSLYSLRVVGIAPEVSYAILAAMFLSSGVIRWLSAGLRDVRKAQLASEIFLVASLSLIATRLWWLVVTGVILFSVPHSLIYPTTLYQALSSGGDPVKANYVFLVSSGAGEVLSPVLAALVITKAGLGALYFAALPISAVSLAASVL